MNQAIEIKNAVKIYKSHRALKSIDLTIYEGEIIGILGDNGSGKTTLLKAIGGYHKLDSGEINIFGEKLNSSNRQLISYLPDTCHLYTNMRIKHLINYYKDFFNDFSEDEFQSMCKNFRLDPNYKIKEMSKGMKEKLGIAFQFSRNTSIYCLDEPLSGVDPLSRSEILDMLIAKAVENKTIIITTQLLTEMENILDRIIFIRDGEILIDAKTSEIIENHEMSLEKAFIKYFRRNNA